ncbi:hypothetical protein ACE6H2_023220 [Prunus campanulata]
MARRTSSSEVLMARLCILHKASSPFNFVLLSSSILSLFLSLLSSLVYALSSHNSYESLCRSFAERVNLKSERNL